MIGCYGVDLALRSHRPQLREEFIHVAHFGAPRAAGRLIGVVPVVAIFLEHRATAGNVVDDRVELPGQERRPILVGKLAGRLAQAAMEMDRPAAGLIGRHMDIAAIVLQHAGRRPIHVSKHRVAGAAEEQADGRAVLANRRKKLGERAFIALGRRQHLDHSPQIRRQQPRHACRLHQLQDAQSLCDPCRHQRSPQLVTIRKQTEQDVAMEPVVLLCQAAILSIGSRHGHAKRLDQLAILHAGRARRLARSAIET